VLVTITNKRGGIMPTMLTEEERIENQARAIWHAGQGHRVRGFFARLWTTQIGDLCHGRVWPNTK
jgi:hypothetical protein